METEIDEKTHELLQMLTYGRPSCGKTERAFIDRWLIPLGTKEDKQGNNWLIIGNSPILFSSHTDTVHREDKICKILFGGGIVTTADSSCLGADCTAGVWLMVQMIKNKIPGVYVFHSQEEIGGRGSNYIATEKPHWLENLQYAIAFDRKGFDEIITHQFHGRTCSDVFAKSLAEILKPLNYRPSQEGLFTDTANYSSIIPECTNISVGYQNCHTSKESLNVNFLNKLLDRLLNADWSRLTCSRNPLEEDLDSWNYNYKYQNPYSSHHITPSYQKLLDYCRQYPTEIAQFLEDMELTVEEIENHIWQDSYQ